MAEAKPAAKPEQDEFDPKRDIRAVYGDMIDPTKPGEPRLFTQKWERIGEVTNWMRAQVAAGKMELEPRE